jgi:hypothetical protein
MQLTKSNESSYNLGRLAQRATITTRVTHKIIVGMVKLHSILKDLVS